MPVVAAGPQYAGMSINFFISYTRNDEQWAKWIADALEEAGYSTVLQAWDFRPGENFVERMDRAMLVSFLFPYRDNFATADRRLRAACSADPSQAAGTSGGAVLPKFKCRGAGP
jgi:TIR domain